MNFVRTTRWRMGATMIVALCCIGGRAPDQTIELPSQPAPLAGTLSVPAGSSAKIAVLLLAGSGPVDRNGSIPTAGITPNTLKYLAEALEGAGFQSLRIDKRCIGESQLACPGEAKLTIDTYIDDAAAWAAMLSRRPGVQCVVILGHSEGALIGAMAAARVPVCGFISVAGAGRPFREVLEEQLGRSGSSEGVLRRTIEIDDALSKGVLVSDVPPVLAALFRPSIQPYLISVMRVDPVRAVAALRCPVLVLQGSEDVQVAPADAKLLQASNPRATVRILKSVNHVLKVVAPGHGADQNAYMNAELPLAPEVAPTIVDFLHRIELARGQQTC